MAKLNRTLTFDKAQINLKDMTITEYLKDETNVYNILDILKDFDMVDGITFSLKQSDKLEPVEDCDREDD